MYLEKPKNNVGLFLKGRGTLVTEDAQRAVSEHLLCISLHWQAGDLGKGMLEGSLFLREDWVRGHLDRLDIHKSMGSDGIHSWVLRAGRHHSQALVISFERSCRPAEMPEDWKKANTTQNYCQSASHQSLGRWQSTSFWRPSLCTWVTRTWSGIVNMDSPKANHCFTTWSPMRMQLLDGWGESSGYCQLQQGFWHCLSWNPHRQNSRCVHWVSGLRTGWTADSRAHYQLLVFIWMAEAGHKVTDTQQSCQHQQQKLLSTSVSALHISTSLLQRAHIQLLAYIMAPLNQTPDLRKTSPEKRRSFMNCLRWAATEAASYQCNMSVTPQQ